MCLHPLLSSMPSDSPAPLSLLWPYPALASAWSFSPTLLYSDCRFPEIVDFVFSASEMASDVHPTASPAELQSHRRILALGLTERIYTVYTMYMTPPCVFSSVLCLCVCMCLHVYSHPMYVHPCVCFSGYMTLHVHFPSVCVSSTCSVCSFHIYVSSMCISSLYVRSLRVYAPSRCMSPPRVCPRRVVSLPYVCFFVWLFFHVYVTSMYMSLRVYITP